MRYYWADDAAPPFPQAPVFISLTNVLERPYFVPGALALAGLANPGVPNAGVFNYTVPEHSAVGYARKGAWAGYAASLMSYDGAPSVGRPSCLRDLRRCRRGCKMREPP